MNKDCETELTVFYLEKTRESNRLQTTLKRQHFLVSYLKIVIEYWPGRGFETPASRSPVLIHLSLPGSSLIHLSVFHYHMNLRLSRQE